MIRYDQFVTSRVTLADGISAVSMFFILQLLFSLLLDYGRSSGTPLLYAFTLAGFVTCGLTLLYFNWIGTSDVPTYRSQDISVSLLYGAYAGLACALFAGAYLSLAQTRAWFPLDQFILANQGRSGELTVLAVLAAPFFEEFIFRGLLFTGLRQRVGPVWAITGSAALFAAVHAPVAVIPVFVLGLVTAALYNWQGTLLISSVAHAVYNISILIGPWMAR